MLRKGPAAITYGAEFDMMKGCKTHELPLFSWTDRG